MWQMLNQMPDALRLPLQNASQKINSDKCRMTKMGEYLEYKPLVEGSKE
jgi:hypothetical protein